jgi:hypothetical protein
MPVTLLQILAQLADGTLGIEEAAAQLEQIALAHPAQQTPLRVRVESEVAAGRVTHAAGRALLSAIERAMRTGVEKTAVMGDAQVDDVTAMRPPGSTQIPPVDATEQLTVRPIAKTLVRPVTESDETTMRPAGEATRRLDADQTQQSASATLRMEPATGTGTLVMPTNTIAHDPDETLATARGVPPTAARTVKMELSTQAMQGFADTLKAPDKTHVIVERLVQSLDDVEQSRRGALEPGAIIKKRFVLETLIGKGGMGLVFSAIDRRKEEAQDPNPRVALKVLNADFERHPQSFIALQREARKAQTLAHPNVVTVFDFDRDGETVYMTMELLRGKPLEGVVRGARGKGIPAAEALPIIRGIAEGLAYAHRKGIVHSDLKPGNVFIAEDGAPKILDFGIARAVPSSVTSENQDVFDAGSLGAYTEAYATDEMIDGIDPHPADDLYALGIIGYELLTGFHPYQRHGAPTARKLGIKPPPLKGLKLREARALERCLSFDRKQRPKDAADFLRAFQGVSTLQKVSIAVAAILAVTVGYLWYQNWVETSPAIPFAQLPQATQQEITAELADGDKEWAFYQQGITPAVEEAVVHYANAYDKHPRNRDAVKGLKKAGDEILKLAGDDPAMRHAVAGNLMERSDFYRKYAPVVEAAK